MHPKVYTALVYWQNGDRVEVDIIAPSKEVARRLLEEKLKREYAPDWEIVEIQLQTPETDS